jgi:hypothetical protein
VEGKEDDQQAQRSIRIIVKPTWAILTKNESGELFTFIRESGLSFISESVYHLKLRPLMEEVAHEDSVHCQFSPRRPFLEFIVRLDGALQEVHHPNPDDHFT